MQVYRGMDIGTAKPTTADRRLVPHHMIDLVEPEVHYTVARFQADGRAVLSELDAAGGMAIVAGGSGLHFRSLVEPMTFPPTDPELRERLEALEPAEGRRRIEAVDRDAGAVVDLDNPRRVVRALEIHELTGATPSERAARPEAEALRAYRPVRPLVVLGLDPGERLGGRVGARIAQMVDAGLLAEVERLAGRLGTTARQAVGYRQLLAVVSGTATLDEGVAATQRATMALAGRQRTFFRRDPRVRWLPWSDDRRRRLEAARRALTEVEGIDG
jgi:tRNA dimethylallyltransferase